MVLRRSLAPAAIAAAVTIIACAASIVAHAARAHAAPGESGTVRGHVQQPLDTAVHDGHRPAIAGLAQSAHPPVDRSRAVVYIDAAPRQAFDVLPTTRVRLDQRNQTFVPHVLAITVGTTVDFPNDDPMFHNVMSLAPGNAFDLGRYPQGRSRSVRFENPGIVPVVCDIHANMSAYILVFNHPFFAVTDETGGYTIAGVPPGAYTLKVWSELGSADARRVTVADGGAADVDFQVVKR